MFVPYVTVLSLARSIPTLADSHGVSQYIYSVFIVYDIDTFSR